jgi:hypothetical protein
LVAGPVVAAVVDENLFAGLDISGRYDPQAAFVYVEGGIFAVFVEGIIDVSGKA